MARLDQIAFLKEAGIDLAPFETRCRWRRFDTDEILVDFDDVSTDVYHLVSNGARSMPASLRKAIWSRRAMRCP